MQRHLSRHFLGVDAELTLWELKEQILFSIWEIWEYETAVCGYMGFWEMCRYTWGFWGLRSRWGGDGRMAYWGLRQVCGMCGIAWHFLDKI